MSIERILSSPSKVQVLRVLSNNSSAYSPQELEKETTKNISVIYDTLHELKEENIIRNIDADGKTNYYRLDKNNPLSNQIRELFKTEREQYNLEEVPAHLENIIFDVEDKLRNQIEEVKMILLFGSVVRGDFTPESDIDLYLVLEDKNTKIEDQVYDILDNYEKEFSVIIRSIEGYRGDFGEDHSELGNSILVEGYSILYISDNIENFLQGKIDLKTLGEELNNAWDLKNYREHAKEDLNMSKVKDYMIEELEKGEK